MKTERVSTRVAGNCQGIRLFMAICATMEGGMQPMNIVSKCLS